ncbi:Na/Pi cotransporter family protein [Shimia aestuarii]|uniref:Phosphate:Na+ symporter n=1 Tax=Shimia aestuarii TaxID=254406 RepID=A0A1I4SSY5_9RHOB|nr:Na/Pi cotransporter family protein [Shimia aestuarii]SFM67515.1 phosphate:Na+ symporter [Shimia aestuarii]
MDIIRFLISLAGATMLLLFAVRMVRTGIERSFGASFQRLLTSNNSLVGAATVGIALAIVLQSSAAVALLATGFSAGGYMSFATALAVVLGGDLGSALVIQVLSFRLDWLVPVLLAFGGWMFVKVEQKRWRQLGRILMGVAFILISLRFLREAMDPIRDSAFLPAISNYLAQDYVTAFIVGAVLAFVMHSSVAAILMCVTLVQIGALPFAAGLSLVLGANFGSAFIPVWLSRGQPVSARRIPYANLGLRGSLASLALVILNTLFDPAMLIIASPAQSLIYAHIGFNLVLLVLALPVCRLLETPVRQLFPDPQTAQEHDPTKDVPGAALDPEAVDRPARAIACIKQELLRMTERVEGMFRPVLSIYEDTDPQSIAAVRARDLEVNDSLASIRDYVASIPRKTCSKAELKTIRGLMEYAIRLETAGDVVAKRLTAIAEERREAGARFSREGWSELIRIQESILANLRLAKNVLLSDDLESARLLMTEKTEVKRLEYTSRKRHLKRLQNGDRDSMQSSDMHLETIRAFREFNSHIAAVAYPILYRNGQLLETRLIEDMEPAES